MIPGSHIKKAGSGGPMGGSRGRKKEEEEVGGGRRSSSSRCGHLTEACGPVSLENTEQ